jgi:hypothetical protein
LTRILPEHRLRLAKRIEEMEKATIQPSPPHYTFSVSEKQDQDSLPAMGQKREKACLGTIDGWTVQERPAHLVHSADDIRRETPHLEEALVNLTLGCAL